TSWLLACFLRNFFFQAEDGIRDLTVTGVQTCALPIWSGESRSLWRNRLRLSPDLELVKVFDGDLAIAEAVKKVIAQRCWEVGPRSEERRVGKECRSRWGREYL